MTSKSTAKYKMIVIGNSNVGKTCLIASFCNKKNDKFTSSVGIDIENKIINLDGDLIKLEIWDTVGQERFNSITAGCFRNTMGVVIMYDITEKDTFDNVPYWISNCHENTSPDIPKILVGNKCEVAPNQRKVTVDMGQKIADDFNMPFFEVSCQNKINVEKSFYTLAEHIKSQKEEQGNTFDSANGNDLPRVTIKVNLSKETRHSKEKASCLCFSS